jgi:hypothetical protein
VSPPRERPMAWSRPLFKARRAMLEGSNDGRIDHGVFIVRIVCQGAKALKRLSQTPLTA